MENERFNGGSAAFLVMISFASGVQFLGALVMIDQGITWPWIAAAAILSVGLMGMAVAGCIAAADDAKGQDEA